MNLWAFGFLIVALVAGVWTFMVWRGFSKPWLPQELLAAKVVFVERQFSCDAPYPVVCRVDQVYKTADGMHVPVEGKNRDGFRVYRTDVVQLSLQAWVMRRKGLFTAPYGFVAVNSRVTGGRKALKVDLMSDIECETVISRYLAVKTGRKPPMKAKGPKCQTCGHQARCRST